MMEYWDVCDRSGRKLGYTKRSDEEFLDGEYHIGASVWIVDSKGKLLIQRRAASKRTGPSLWSITGGKVQAGERSIEACVREVKEELGLVLDEQDIRFLYRSTGSDMLFDDYIVICDLSIERARLDDSEVSEIRWADLDEIRVLCHNREFMYNDISDLAAVRDYLDRYFAGKMSTAAVDRPVTEQCPAGSSAGFHLFPDGSGTSRSS